MLFDGKKLCSDNPCFSMSVPIFTLIGPSMTEIPRGGGAKIDQPPFKMHSKSPVKQG